MKWPFHDLVQEISCLGNIQGEPQRPRRPVQPWSRAGSGGIEELQEPFYGRHPGIINGVFDFFTIAVGDHLAFDSTGAYSLSGRTDFNGFYSDTVVTISR